MSLQVLVVEDDAPVREALGQTLELADFNAILTSSFVMAKDHIRADFDGVIVSDIRMPGRDGLYLLDFARDVDADLPVILLTGEGDIPMAVGAINKGAFHFLEKPCSNATLLDTVRRASQARRLVLENRRLKAEIRKGDAAARMLFGQSDLADRLRAQVRLMAPLDGPVVINGAPGSGVAKIAEVIHLLSTRADGPFVKLGAAGLATEVLDGALARAAGGSLFLDELGALPAATQFALSGYLDGGLGARVLAGNTRDLTEACAQGRFSADLKLQIEALSVRVPALKERPEDIPVLFRHYVAQACEQAGIDAPEITDTDLTGLMAQDWPGNARALMNTAMRFAMGLGTTEDEGELGLVERMAQVERALLIDALKRQRGNASATAEQLKLPRKTLYDKFARHGITPDEYRV